MQAVLHFGDQNTDRLRDLNSANICLIPKKEEALRLEDFRPISLMHSFAKIVAKILASRLAPRLNELISQNQSAFIRKRAIHDNFLYVQNLVRLLHRKNKPSLFIKVDISKAFDTVNWVYLLETLQNFGFGQRWRNWIANLLANSSSRILLNGNPGEHIFHARGLRQGDSLSPMLFIITMEPLHHLIKMAEEANILSNLFQRNRRFRCSLYADDVAIFAKPTSEELTALSRILSFFAEISGLHTNMSKTEIFPIRCSEVDLDNVLLSFPGNKKSFPCKYLGIPLHIRKLRKVDLQPLVDKVGSRIPGWKGRFFTSAGREVLVKSALTATPIYHLSVLPQNKWLYKRIDRLRRAFLWKGDDPDNVGSRSCLLNWNGVCKPKDLGGLGILNLEKFARALRLRWLWFEWKDVSKPWVNMGTPCDDIDKALFQASTIIHIRNGQKAKFWTDSWLEGCTVKELAPLIFRLAKRRTKCVSLELQNNHWMSGLHTITTIKEIDELVQLGGKLQNVALLHDIPDDITWKWNENGQYSTKSAYLTQFKGEITHANFLPLWKTNAEPKQLLWMVGPTTKNTHC